MKTFLKILGGIVIVALLAVMAVNLLTRQQRGIGRDFVTLASTGQFDAAHALFHPALQDAYPLAQLQAQFGTVAEYVEVRFTAVESDGSGTRLDGTATTATGCTSRVHFEILSGQITAFEVSPLCPGQ